MGGNIMIKRILFIFLGSFLLTCLLPAHSGALFLQGPVLDQAEEGWNDFGLVIRAEADVMLVSVHYPNQGAADNIELRLHSDGTLLSSTPVLSGNPDATVNINYPLTEGEIYDLVSTTPNNRYWAYAQLPFVNSEITVLSSYGTDLSFPYNAFWFAFDEITTQISQPVIQEIAIDIKPGSSQNSINLKSKGVVTVAILTSGNFDARDVNQSSVAFAGAAPVRCVEEDVDGDGDDDLVCHFRTQDLISLDENSTEAYLTGSTYDGIPIEGADTVDITPKKK